MAAPTPTGESRQHYRELVAQVAEKARAILPQAVNGRLEAGVRLVLQGDVMPQADGSVQVGSSDPTRYYVLQGTSCTCTDFTQGKAPEGWCKHRISAGIHKRVHELLAAMPASQPTPEPPAPTALPEAPASCNVRLVVQGREVQWTLRDTDEARLADRLMALLARFPQPEKPAEDTAKMCPTHGVPLKLNHGKNGKSWWSHRTEQGWCKGK